MSDTQAAMREFRFLDDKRRGGGLSPVEEQRWIDLGAQLGMTAQQGYVGEDGLWYAYPPGYDPNTGQYYGQQPQYGYAPQPPQQYYDPNQAYYPQQPAPQYDPNTGQYYDPNAAYGYPPQPQPQYQPPQQWHEPTPHPQAPGEWPQNYDPNTGQYYQPPGYAPPAPSQPTYVPPAPQAWQPPAPAYEPPAYAPPAQAYAPPEPEPFAAPEEEGPLEVGEDEVMEVTDDDVTLLDASPPVASTPASAELAPLQPLTPEKPLVDPMGDLKSALSFDEPAAPTAPPADVIPELPPPGAETLAEPEPAPLIAAEPDIAVDLAPEPAAPPPPPAMTPEPPPVIAAEPEFAVDLTPEPSPPVAPLPPPAMPPEPPPIVAAEPEIVAAEPEIAVELAAEPVAPPPPPAMTPEPPPITAPEAPVEAAAVPAPVTTAPEPALPVEPPAQAPVPEASFEPEIEEAPVEAAPSIMVADDLGAQSFAGTPRNRDAEAQAELPPLSELSAMLGGAPQPPPPPPPSVPDAPAAPIALTSVAPISATVADLYPQGIPEPVVPPLPPKPVSFDLEAIPDPRPSIPISISVEEPVHEAALDVEPLLEAEVEAEPLPPEPKPIPPPPPAMQEFAPSLDDLPVAHEPEPVRSNHTGFEASLGDLPPAIADAPPPPIIDVFANPSAPVDTFETTSAPQVMDFDVSIDDKPVPVEAPLDLSGSADEKIELAKTSDFLDYSAAQPQAEAASFSTESGESLLESGTLSTFANPAGASTGPAPLELPPEEPGGMVPLASNADFLGMSELNNTGESWQKQDNGVALEATLAEPEPEPEPEPAAPPDEDIIQGVALEEEPIEAEIQAEVEADIEPEPWAPPSAPAPLLQDRAPLAIPPPAAAAPSAYVPPPPKPIPAPPPGPMPSAAPPAPIAAAPAAATRPGPPTRPPAQPFAPAPAKAPNAPLFDTSGGMLREEPGAPIINGEHRVILHTVEGQVKRGLIRDSKLGDDTVGLEAQPGAVERIPRPRIKAIFFMLPAGAKAPSPTGDKLRVTFKDGRQLAGFSTDHRAAGIGFFVVPADNRTNTERIFIYRSSVEKVAVD